MNRRYPVVGIAAGLLLGLLLSGCSSLSEQQTYQIWTERPELGLRLRVVPPENLPQAVVGERQQVLLVVGIRPGWPAAKAGIETGDILLALDGQPVSGMADSMALMQAHQWGDLITLTILRGGQLQNISLNLEL